MIFSELIWGSFVLLKSIKTFIALTLLLIENILGQMQQVPNNNFIYVEEKVEEYVAFLKIPKINLEQPLYENGDIDKNIIFINGSDMPTIKKGNVIIAGHSGASEVSYFRYLYKLDLGDIVYLEYKGKNYKYKIDNRYFVKKTGNVEIIRDNNANTVTLITCHGKDKQLVLVANLIK